MGLGGGVAEVALGANKKLTDWKNPPKGYTKWDRNTSFGNADDFGGADYGEALKAVAGNREHLQYRRKEIMDWLGTDEGQASLWEGNRKGKGTFYDKLASGDQSWSYGINPGHKTGDPTQADHFGYVDLYHSQALGKTDREIADFAKQHKDKFRNFGLYQSIQTAGDVEDKQATQQKQFQELVGDKVTDFGDKVTDYGSALEKKLSDIQGTFKQDKEATAKSMKQFAENQAAYEKQQSAWQQRQAAATQQMQIQQMKAMNQKPVMQIMPTGAGGGGMSAGSLATKKKQITGLNIN